MSSTSPETAADVAAAVLAAAAQRLGLTPAGLLELAADAPRFAPELPRHVALDVVATRLDVPRDLLRRLARQGRFPRLVEIAKGTAVVRLDELVTWLRGQELSVDAEPVRDALMREAGRGSAMPFGGGTRSRRSGGRGGAA
jgi:hypothetical protein